MSSGRVLLLILAIWPAGVRAAEPSISDLLSSMQPEKREQAAVLLGKQGDVSAAKKLMVLFRDRDWGVRMAAIRALGPIRNADGRKALRRMAAVGQTRGLRVLAAETLRDHDAKNSAPLIAKRMRKIKKEARLPLIEALGIIGTDAGIEGLSKQMRAPDKMYREAAARALGRLGAGEKALTAALKDKQTHIRWIAVTALAQVDSDAARAAVLDFMAKADDDLDAWIHRRVGRRAAKANRAAFAKALSERIEKARRPGPLLYVGIEGAIGECAPAARLHFRHRDPLVRAFAFRLASFGKEPVAWEDVEKSLVQKDRRLRYAASLAYLRTVEGAELTERVNRLLAHKHGDVAMEAVRVAVDRRDKDTLAALTALASGKTAAKRDWQARTAACVAMGRVAYTRAFPALKELVRAREWWLRAAALEGLYHCYTKECIPLLIAAFDDRHPVARLTARKNLHFMTRKRYLRKRMYIDYWEKVKATVEIKHPESTLKELERGGYSTRTFLQEILKGTDIVVVLGRWDRVQVVLEDLQVKHQAIRAQQIKTFGVSPKQVVLINCEGSVDSETTRYLQWFVVAGGYMATTDWALVNALTRTFPKVFAGYVRQSTGNDVVVVEPAAPEHPVLRGVFRPNVELKWWLEIQAFPIKVDDPLRAVVLVDSLEMLTRYGSSTMMGEFRAGLGKVLHSTSHFYLQKEGFSSEGSALLRKIFAVDHLGLSIAELRELDSKGAFDNINNTTPISRSYSMFHLLVNFIDEKRRIDLEK